MCSTSLNFPILETSSCLPLLYVLLPLLTTLHTKTVNNITNLLLCFRYTNKIGRYYYNLQNMYVPLRDSFGNQLGCLPSLPAAYQGYVRVSYESCMPYGKCHSKAFVFMRVACSREQTCRQLQPVLRCKQRLLSQQACAAAQLACHHRSGCCATGCARPPDATSWTAGERSVRRAVCGAHAPQYPKETTQLLTSHSSLNSLKSSFC